MNANVKIVKNTFGGKEMIGFEKNGWSPATWYPESESNPGKVDFSQVPGVKASPCCGAPLKVSGSGHSASYLGAHTETTHSWMECSECNQRYDQHSHTEGNGYVPR